MIKTGLIVLWVLLALLWVLGIIFQVLMIANRKPGIGLFDRQLMFNPFNVQFFGDEYLTPRGMQWRNLSWFCFGVFVAVIVLVFAAYYYLRATRP